MAAGVLPANALELPDVTSIVSTVKTAQNDNEQDNTQSSTDVAATEENFNNLSGTMTANKGVGVESLCRVLGFAHDEVMAFGDTYNDVAMLDLVGTPYIMDSAAAPLRARYPLHTPRPEDVLREFLQK